jgi:hypothetical protein
MTTKNLKLSLGEAQNFLPKWKGFQLGKKIQEI